MLNIHSLFTATILLHSTGHYAKKPTDTGSFNKLRIKHWYLWYKTGNVRIT